jgi:peptidoglycan/xylan/chitin deacetylase (PgdA/CDA1 family)
MHSHTHPTKMEYLSAAEQRREYGTNHDLLAALLGTRPTTVSHPCNSYSAETLRILADLGVRLGFRADVARPVASMLELPREDHANLRAASR